jgi:nucleotide-binding universal stress UspA family protein
VKRSVKSAGVGSVAEKVLRKASCPVMTVPPATVSTAKVPYTRLLSCGLLRLLVGREAAEGDRSDLVIMGVRGRNPVDLAVFGSTTNHVVRQASCPVLTMRAYRLLKNAA